jgi:hypothetical protein
MVETAVVRRLGGFDENLWHLQDWDLWLRLAAEGSAAVSPEVLVGYVLHGENSFLGDPAHDVLDDLAYLLRKHAAGPHSLEVDAASFGRWVAFRLRRAGRRRRAALLYLRSAHTNRSVRDLLLAAYSFVDGRIADVARAAVRGRRSRLMPAPPVREPAWLARYR